MTLTLPPELQQFVEEQIESGQYPNQADVIHAGLHLLLNRRDELRSLLATGIDQADRGEVAPFDPMASLAEIKRRRVNHSAFSSSGSLKISSSE